MTHYTALCLSASLHRLLPACLYKIDLFSNEFLLKHSRVSHSSSFLSSVARKGVSIYLPSAYFLVLGVAKRGVSVHPWIRH